MKTTWCRDWLLVALALFLAMGAASARKVKMVTTDDLYARAGLVCNGTVLEINKTKESGRMGIPGSPSTWTEVEFWMARIQIMSVFKGKPPEEIEVLYPRRAENPLGRGNFFEVDGAIHVALVPGERYRFFLKRVQGYYVGVLNEDYDDGFAVQPLLASEHDNSPPLIKTEAIRLATEWVKIITGQPLTLEVDPGASQWQGKWTVRLVRRGPTGPREAEISVDGDRAIDPASWMALEGSELRERNLGQTVQIHFNLPLKDSLAGLGAIQGRLKNFTSEGVGLEAVHELYAEKQGGEPRHWPALDVPAADILEFRVLAVNSLGADSKEAR